MKRDVIMPVRNIYRANKAKDKTEYLDTFSRSSGSRAKRGERASQAHTRVAICLYCE
jgi:hypothetical protein